MSTWSMGECAVEQMQFGILSADAWQLLLAMLRDVPFFRV
jgi:hypothetical protein